MTPEPVTPGPVTDGPFARDFTALMAGDEASFDALAEAAFRFQAAHNPVYAAFADGHAWRSWRHAPYLPAEAFRLAPVAAFDPSEAERVFESSGTGGAMGNAGAPARHYVRSLAVYDRSAKAGFRRAFGEGPFTLVAHLPAYAERGERSSLVHMAERLIEAFGDEASGFFLDDTTLFVRAIAHANTGETRLIVLGAAFGLLDLLDARSWPLPKNAVVVETGGMKTHRRELARADLHARLAEGFGVPSGHVGSEYGMCELLSQAWAVGGAVFAPPPWLRARVVDPADPACEVPDGEPGQLALCDLANGWSCSFVLTEDRAVMRGAGFEVLGRLDRALLRGCNFLVERA